ncbi:MAG: hypothetical protein HYU88_00405 [Chloroflexi bacterium]|nr:hypothetical protein [Chloroflexota bacterium]
MAIGIISATESSGTLHVEVCPRFESGQCACPGSAEHQTFRFGALPPEGDARAADEWALACAHEALRLAQALAAQESLVAEAVPGLAGLVL